MKTRLQLDETAKHLQNLESATRRAVSAAVKEFNKSQVHPGLHPGGTDTHTAASPGVPPPPVPRLSPSLAHTTPRQSPAGAAQLGR